MTGSQSADYGTKRATPEQVVTIALDTLDRRSAPVGDHQRQAARAPEQAPAATPDVPVHGLARPPPATTALTIPREDHP
ncbi:hypothetical protein ABZ345_07820 [Lentzea sp. NPDC005914]|uniref:hypothetical protein n=1 Tax=Lentzea sp. NPDC005914 TaxID=3154572 RepID=UPI0033D86DD7